MVLRLLVVLSCVVGDWLIVGTMDSTHLWPLLCPTHAALCTLEEFESAIAFGRKRRDCSAPDEDESSSSDLSSSAGAQQQDHFTFSQYLSASILLGLVALCAVLGLRSQRKKPKSRWGEERANLLG